METLSALLQALVDVPIGDAVPCISALTNDSRQVKDGTLFLAYPGAQSDGRDYIAQAIAQGAAAVCYEPEGVVVETKNSSIPLIPVHALRSKQSLIAARFYDFPSQKMPVIGVTGTNGKTSVTYFIAQLLGERTAVVGTTGYGFPPELKKLNNTTPDSVQLQKLLADLLQQGATSFAMEVSSHALDQHRVRACQFHTAVFTNLTQDHLDYHGTMENYRSAKESLFQLPKLKYAVINIDDPAGQYFADKYKHQLSVITYSINNSQASIFLVEKKVRTTGFSLTVQLFKNVIHCDIPLIGEFNIANVLAAIGVMIALEKPIKIDAFSTLSAPPGRMQLVQKTQAPTTVIDYAHTPDALEKALLSVRSHCRGKVICVFGCGGNRDKGKRPIMGEIAGRLCDRVIITNDNPREENPALIAHEVFLGLATQEKASIFLDRAEAIHRAFQMASENDWLLIAGKGHETEQIIGKQSFYFSDYEEVMSHY